MRNNSVTIAKGIAILLMVMGHARCPEIVNNYLGMMRMPLFFIMSGFCFKEKSLLDAKGYMHKRFKGIYLPYVKWAIVFLMLHNFFMDINLYSEKFAYLGKTSTYYSLMDYVRKLFLITFTMLGEEQLLGGFWFLNALFVGSTFFYITLRLVKQKMVGCIFLLALTLFFSFFNIQIPYMHIGSIHFFSAFFIMFGAYYKEKGFNIEYNIGFCIFSLLMVGIGTYFWKASMLNYECWQIIPYAFTSILGTLVIFNLSHFIEKKKQSIVMRLLVYIGGYTFNVLTWHMICLKIVSLIIICIYDLPIYRLAEFPVMLEYARKGWWILYFLLGAGVPLVWTYYYHMLQDKISTFRK